jgi:hypothetical protein
MSEQDNKAITRRVYDEVWTKGNLDVIDELIDPRLRKLRPQQRDWAGARCGGFQALATKDCVEGKVGSSWGGK